MTKTDSPTRPGIYIRGTETVDAILKAALDVLIDEGAEGFTIRRIATRCDMKVGNVSYHFPRKEMLIQILLDELVNTYGKLLENVASRADLSPDDRLKQVIILCLDDIGSKRTTRLFTELWALANHNEAVAERVGAFYAQVHGVIGDCVAAINPGLPADDVQSVALFISASMEGATPFLGHGKPWAHKRPAFTALAVQSLIALAHNASSHDIAELAREVEPA
ncbi:AcrR family transcriptional regulator [Sphingobium sp. OAS761]|uniref:TetR/AcrR family transcriptional regulator n=1 Tax=Sphingobium sp. OAS761 TaxID=2817901 RepID=UPI00209F29E9|nr:TetR family transcriptional regulator C-terminal domain-containing protein [Sphingobium sp. OAS761]MCP1469509.1 AcrR family transcriptional regulator [Sphingobium sp. OAS761]